MVSHNLGLLCLTNNLDCRHAIRDAALVSCYIISKSCRTNERLSHHSIPTLRQKCNNFFEALLVQT
jgi:hypothetical protein